MSLSDPIADMFTRLRNAQSARHKSAVVPYSRFKYDILKLLLEEGYVDRLEKEDVKIPKVKVFLKYHEERPVISMIKRVSRPGLRAYCGYRDLPEVMDGLGVVIVSTPKGVMTGHEAMLRCLGGEVLGYIA